MVLVAVGTDDGVLLADKHFGDSKYFYIYKLENGDWKLVEIRENKTLEIEEDESYDHGDPRKFRKVIDLLKDVDILVAFRMGPNYKRIVQNTDKKPFLAGTRDIQQALQKLKANLQKFLTK
ncbi:MAG: NifB/NifX family molybdenum-iron cluster-binding protein [Candidatus Asgardarchaeia archaeon]